MHSALKFVNPKIIITNIDIKIMNQSLLFKSLS